jgi:hypothetical protein
MPDTAASALETARQYWNLSKKSRGEHRRFNLVMAQWWTLYAAELAGIAPNKEARTTRN